MEVRRSIRARDENFHSGANRLVAADPKGAGSMDLDTTVREHLQQENLPIPANLSDELLDKPYGELRGEDHELLAKVFRELAEADAEVAALSEQLQDALRRFKVEKRSDLPEPDRSIMIGALVEAQRRRKALTNN